MLPEILGELGWNTYMVGKWHLCPTVEMNVASTTAELADRAAGSSAGTGSWAPRRTSGIPDLVYDNHPVDQPKSPGGGLPPHRGPDRQGARVHQGRQGDRAGQAVLPLLRAWRRARAAPCRARSGPTSSRAGSTWATRRCGSRRSPGRRSWASSLPTPSSRRSTRSAPPRPAPGPTGKPFPPLDVTRPWDSLTDDEKRLFARMAEVYAGFLAHADHHIGRLLDYLEESGQRENTLVIVVSDNGASGEGGPNGSVNEIAVRSTASRTTWRPTCAMLDELGGTKTYNHYPNGWAMAFNTPFKMWKRYEFNGGTSDPCIISWPAGMKAQRRAPDAVPPRDRHRADHPGLPRRRGSARRSRATCRAASTA